ncbi:MAG: DNA primase [Flavobacteriales bacterium]|nr:DNA primase [Flavobacteriales bacterium]MBK9195726.1 DNA primase [Flavobacteriales bacterium]
MIRPDAIQQVKDAARIDEVVGQFVNLKRKGPRFLGLCPFHNEKTPSFNVVPAMGIYKCFGCGESGDSIGFLIKHEHHSYVEAIRWLAKYYNIELPEEEATPEQAAEQTERESIAVIQAWAQKWSSEHLWETDEGKRIGLSYFHERGFRDDIIKQFQLGYVPEFGNAFSISAIANGFNPELLEKAGWIKRREDGNAWDFFAGRVTFPVHGLSGQIIAFGARTLKSDKKLPKYFNSPESALYVKSRSLYGIAFAKKAIVEQGTCLLVEGYTDVISLHQAGIANVVASSGTSLTVEQVRLIKRYSTSVTILYDGDPAGIKASLRGIDLILAEGLSVKVVLFPDGEDPDSFARKRPSSEVLDFIAKEAKDFIVFKADMLVREAEGDPVKKAAAIHEIVASIALVPDHVLRSLYLQQCSRLLGVQEQALISEMNKVLRQQYRKKVGGEEVPPEVLAADVAPPQQELQDLGTQPQERELLRLLIQYGHVPVSQYFAEFSPEAEAQLVTIADWIFQELEEDDLKLHDQLVNTAFGEYRQQGNTEPESRLRYFIENPSEELKSFVLALITERHQLDDWKRRKIHVVHERDELRTTVMLTLRRYKERYVDLLLADKSEAIKTADEVDCEILMKEKIALEKFRSSLSAESGRVSVG